MTVRRLRSQAKTPFSPSAERRGRIIRSVKYSSATPSGEIDVPASLLTGLRRQVGSPTMAELRRLGIDDLRQRVRLQHPQRLTIFVVDASESMGEDSALRMAAAKGAVLVLLREAYVNRDRVAMIAFRGESADVVVPPTRSIELARERLRHLAVGGATPLAAGLRSALQLVRREQLKQREIRPLLVLLSDGESNVPLQPGRSLWDEIQSLAGDLRKTCAAAVVIAAGNDTAGLHKLKSLAKSLGGEFYRLDTLRTRQVVDIVRSVDIIKP